MGKVLQVFIISGHTDTQTHTHKHVYAHAHTYMHVYSNPLQIYFLKSNLGANELCSFCRLSLACKPF
jgi:hypothetical protein